MSSFQILTNWAFELFKTEALINEEKMEEYRMLSGFKIKEINRLYKEYYKFTEGKDLITKEIFLNIPAIVNNPFKERIAFCFGFDEEKVELDFQAFLIGLSLFNSPGQRDQKLKTAFKIQDFDNDGILTLNDLKQYLSMITSYILEDKEISEICQKILFESSSDLNKEFISYSDFQKIVSPTDFQAKLLIPI